MVVSKCLEFEPCRWNGELIKSEIVSRMRKEVDFLPVCMEVEIGLGVPREPIRVVRSDGDIRLVQPATGRDLTERANEFCQDFLSSVGEVDGFVLKSGSPSCGLHDTRIYPSIERSPMVDRSHGFFGRAVLNRFPDKAVEDESRLRNFKIAEHFMTKLFTLASFREVHARGWVSLKTFHRRNRLLLMAYHQGERKEMGKIVANEKGLDWERAYERYGKHLTRAMSNGPKCSSSINVLMHAMGRFSDQLTPEEKGFFLDSLMDYREGRIPLSVSMGVIRSWVVRFDDPWLEEQTYFHPFPNELLDVELTDSCRIRDYWKSQR